MPSWAKKTIPSASGKDCENLGVMFGRTENQLLFYSWYDGKNALSMLTSSGTWLWGVNLKDGDSVKNNMLAFSAVDSSTDVTIVTSGISIINYSLVVTSSVSPYSLKSSS